MKALKWVAFVSVAIGIVLLFIGVGYGITLKHKLQAIYIISYFLGAISFFLVSTVILLYVTLSKKKAE